MFPQYLTEQQILAQAQKPTPKPTPKPAQKQGTPTKAAPAPQPEAKGGGGYIWIVGNVVLILVIAGLVAYGKWQYEKLQKAVKFEQFKSQDLQKRLKLALKTIQKMETNPDLIHSREFNLDYLRLRMDEEVFHYAIINQVKIRVKQIISVALRPNTATQQVGIAATSRQVDETFEVTYETETRGKRVKRILFRCEVKLTKLPTQSTSTTINQIIDCIEKFLSPNEDHDNWQPTIQGRVVVMDWDQKAKPTPLLVLEQSGEGVNVSFRTNPNKRGGSLTGEDDEDDDNEEPTTPAPKGQGKRPAPPGGKPAPPPPSGKRPAPPPPPSGKRPAPPPAPKPPASR